MGSPGDIDQVLNTVQISLGELKIPFVACSLNLVNLGDEPPQEIFYHMGVAAGDWSVAEDDHAVEVIREIWQRGEVVYRRDPQAEDELDEQGNIDRVYGQRIRSVVEIPFSHGTLAVNSDRAAAFSPDHIDQLRELVGVLEEGFYRKDDLERLARSRDQFRTLVETPEMGVVLMTPEGRYLYINPYWVEQTGYGADEFFTDPDLGQKLVHPDDLPAIEEMMAGVLRGEAQTGVEFRWRPRNREDYSWAVETVYPVCDHQGEISALQALIVDIDGCKQVEREDDSPRKAAGTGGIGSGSQPQSQQYADRYYRARGRACRSGRRSRHPRRGAHHSVGGATGGRFGQKAASVGGAARG